MIRLAQIYLAVERFDRATELLALCTQRFPADATGWYNLGLVQSLRHNCAAALAALATALAAEPINGPLHRACLQDGRFDNCRADSRFQALVAPGPAPPIAPTGPFRITP